MKQSTGHVLPGKLLVKQDAAEETTSGGIIIPDISREKPKTGEVIVAGESTSRISMVVEPGDRVMFEEGSGFEFDIDDSDMSLKGKYLLLDQARVLIYKRKTS